MSFFLNRLTVLISNFTEKQSAKTDLKKNSKGVNKNDVIIIDKGT